MGAGARRVTGVLRLVTREALVAALAALPVAPFHPLRWNGAPLPREEAERRAQAGPPDARFYVQGERILGPLPAVDAPPPGRAAGREEQVGDARTGGRYGGEFEGVPVARAGGPAAGRDVPCGTAARAREGGA